MTHLLLGLLFSTVGDYAPYVRVPYSQTVDELLYVAAVSGKLKVSKDFVRRDGKLYTTRTTDGKETEVPPLMCGMFVFDCHYDEGSYFVPEHLYRDIKDELIARRQGRLESFALPNPTAKVGEFPDTKDPKAFETYVWDSEGKVWRWPTTLRTVDSTHRLKSGQRLYEVKLAPGLATATLEKLVQQHAARFRNR